MGTVKCFQLYPAFASITYSSQIVIDTKSICQSIFYKCHKLEKNV